MKRVFLLLIMWLGAAAGAHAVTPWDAPCLQPIAIGQTISGRLDTSDCSVSYADAPADIYYTDVYTFQGQRGQRITIQMSSPEFDTWLELHSANDKDEQPLYDDDDGGGGTDSRIPSDSGDYTLPATGTYYIWANSSPPAQTGAYTITLSAAEVDAWAPNCVQPIAFGQTINGTLSTNSCSVQYTDISGRYYTDVYTFQGTAGQQIAVALDSPDFDAWLELHIVNDKEADPLYTGDDVVGTNARIPIVSGYYTLPDTGTYYIWANTAGTEETGNYRLRLSEAKPMLTVTEFYHPEFNHYFITAYPDEAASLAAGNLPPWVPTGQTFKVWGSAGTFIDNVWRFFSASFAPLSGHFYTQNEQEAATLQQGNVWTLEASDAFYMMGSPDGTCESGTQPLYRLYNNGQGGAPNHRYTTDSGIRSQMITEGWIPEGNGSDGVFACVPQ